MGIIHQRAFLFGIYAEMPGSAYGYKDIKREIKLINGNN